MNNDAVHWWGILEFPDWNMISFRLRLGPVSLEFIDLFWFASEAPSIWSFFWDAELLMMPKCWSLLTVNANTWQKAKEKKASILLYDPWIGDTASVGDFRTSYSWLGRARGRRLQERAGLNGQRAGPSGTTLTAPLKGSLSDWNEFTEGANHKGWIAGLLICYRVADITKVLIPA